MKYRIFLSMHTCITECGNGRYKAVDARESPERKHRLPGGAALRQGAPGEQPCGKERRGNPHTAVTLTGDKILVKWLKKGGS